MGCRKCPAWHTICLADRLRLGEAKPSNECTYKWRACYLDERPIASFTFKYRSEGKYKLFQTEEFR